LFADVVKQRLPAPSPRVTVVMSRLDIGGTEQHLIRVLPELHRRGIDISLYVLEQGGKLDAEFRAQGLRVDGPSGKGPSFLKLVAAAAGLVRYLRRERPDIVHFFLPRPYIVGSLAAELVGHCRRIMSRRSLATYHKRYPLIRLLEKVLHRRTVALLGNSNAVVEELSAETGDRNRVGLIHSGVDVPDMLTTRNRLSVRDQLGIPADAYVIVIVANLIGYKGHEDLIDALGLVHSSLPQPWRLLAIGRDDGIGAELQRKADGLGMAANILWMGERTDVELLLRGADIMVLASHEEGFSNALLEAMACGIASIATRVGGNVDAIIDDECGLLVSPHAPAELGWAILRLAKDGPLRSRLSIAARARVGKLYSSQGCINKYERLYRRISETNMQPIDEIISENSKQE
jgi:glycosyltransferase involved in cell wall biosynthesis